MPAESSSVVLFQNVAGQVLADPAGFIRLQWSDQPRRLADTQAFLNAASQAMRQRSWSRLLGNQVTMVPFSSEEQQWISTEWLPAAVRENGYRSGAILVSSNVLTRLATAYITTNVQDIAVRYRSFDSEAEAVAWLLRQHE